MKRNKTKWEIRLTGRLTAQGADRAAAIQATGYAIARIVGAVLVWVMVLG